MKLVSNLDLVSLAVEWGVSRRVQRSFEVSRRMAL